MDVVSAARAAHAEGLAVRFSQLVFDNVDDDWSGTITDDEFGALVSVSRGRQPVAAKPARSAPSSLRQHCAQRLATTAQAAPLTFVRRA